MTAYKPGDDVLVDFDGIENCRGEVVRYSSGYVMAVIDLTDHEETDWKGVSGPGRMDPQPTVCVPERHVRPAPPAAVPGGLSGPQ